MIDNNKQPSNDTASEKKIVLTQEAKPREIPTNLDELVELLNEDDLRNIAGGMARPKGRPYA
jgi:hypothetical protein